MEVVPVSNAIKPKKAKKKRSKMSANEKQTLKTRVVAQIREKRTKKKQQKERKRKDSMVISGPVLVVDADAPGTNPQMKALKRTGLKARTQSCSQLPSPRGIHKPAHRRRLSLLECTICGQEIRSISQCAACEGSYCKDCLKKCKGCEDTVCTDCIDNVFTYTKCIDCKQHRHILCGQKCDGCANWLCFDKTTCGEMNEGRRYCSECCLFSDMSSVMSSEDRKFDAESIVKLLDYDDESDEEEEDTEEVERNLQRYADVSSDLSLDSETDIVQ
jgi:hypothetical protein